MNGVLLFDGTLKDKSELKLGDILMGPDSNPRVINKIQYSDSKLYRVSPKKGESFLISNKEKILLFRSKNSCLHLKERYELDYEEYFIQNISFKRRYCLSKTLVEFKNLYELPIKPYILGLWLGDGTSCNTNLTTMDDVIYEEYKVYVESLDLILKPYAKKGKATTYAAVCEVASNSRSRPNKYLNKLRNLNLIENKHIPSCYLTANRNDRLELLAGLIDTDGSLLSNNVLEITQKNKRIAEGIVYLARSLGFACTIRDSLKSSQTGTVGLYNRIQICGDTSKVPVRLKRKKSKPFKQEKNPLKIGISTITFEKIEKIVSFSFEGSCQKYIDNNFFIRIA
jgi:replicative DNA helicase